MMRLKTDVVEQLRVKYLFIVVGVKIYVEWCDDTHETIKPYSLQNNKLFDQGKRVMLRIKIGFVGQLQGKDLNALLVVKIHVEWFSLNNYIVKLM